MKASTRAYGRLNITLPRTTVELLDRVTKKGNRSRFIDQAIRELALGRTRTRLRKLLEEEGRVNRDRYLRLTAEWAAVDAETWPVRRRR
jgi:CopG family transcriptional regulator / antitoxin EndoAI